MPLIGVSARFLFATRPTTGTLNTCSGVSDSNSNIQCADRIVPAVWELQFTSGHCFRTKPDATDVDVPAGGVVDFVCEEHRGRFFLFSSSMDVNAPPPTIQLTGEGIDSTYGMPVIDIINTSTGELAATTTASSMNATWVEAPTPFLGFTYSGEYAAVVYNVRSDGSLEGIGGDWLTLYGNDPPPPPDEDPCLQNDPSMPAMPCENNNY